MRDILFKQVVLSLFLLLFLQGYSQKSLTKVVVNSNSKLPIDFAFITSPDKKMSLMTNKEGKFMLIPDPEVKTYRFYRMGYYPLNKSAAELAKCDTIFLKERSISLDEITVTSKVIETIVKDKRYYVNDYLVLPNSDILLLTSKINFNGFDIAYYKRDKGITCSKHIKNETGEEFKLDCFNNVQLLTNVYSRQLFFMSDSLFDFLDRNDRAFYDNTLGICVLKTDTEVVFKTSLPPRQIDETTYFDVYANSPFMTFVIASKHIRKRLYTVSYSKELKEMYYREVSDMKMIQATTKLLTQGTGAHMASQQSCEAQMDLFFTKVAKPIYAPVFQRQDSIIVFNFNENVIVYLNNNGKVLKQVKIDEKDFSQFRDFEVIHDPIKQQFYLRTKGFDHCNLSLLDINTGKIAKKIKLEKKFAKNIQILNGHAYYLVKEKEWDDTCYLYQQNNL